MLTPEPTPLIAPFPWYGGKRRWADLVWKRFGDVDTYLEPFAGSLAILLAAPSCSPREIVCDTNGLLCNFWRAVKWAPDEVAEWADWPTVHDDLTARHQWLCEWRDGNRQRLIDDPGFFDARVAGWWVWGISSWIGGGWCEDRGPQQARRPHVHVDSSGQGVQAQRVGIPHIGKEPGGQGVQAQRVGQIPFPGQVGGGGMGVQAQRLKLDIAAIMNALAERLHRVVVLNRSWESVTSSTVMGDTKSHPGIAGIVLDPPYLTAGRHAGIYDSDRDGTSDDVARASWEWAQKVGHRHRVAYFCHEGDFEVPDGWTTETMSFGGIRSAARKAERQDMVMFSPACLDPAQGSLL